MCGAMMFLAPHSTLGMDDVKAQRYRAGRASGHAGWPFKNSTRALFLPPRPKVDVGTDRAIEIILYEPRAGRPSKIDCHPSVFWRIVELTQAEVLREVPSQIATYPDRLPTIL